MNYFLTVLKKYAVFDGRASRSEYWYFALFNFIITVILGFIDGLIGFDVGKHFGILGGIYFLVILIPSIAVSVRRLHDTGRTGWWVLIAFVPLLGAIIFLVFAVQDSQAGENKYGQNPKEILTQSSS